ncbi:plasmid partitioning protein RepB [Bosea sp. (in: a-proteobacteria)]|uniref:plasmid partitioning protein RepB n=1 Tax=Bosea sp. (in: a-proteobacteria) TaxID=1871050 RepID=UPI000B2010FC|nr:plasmid partitioning protein RepB [Bosea sp. (in: a-proteobacteria)]MDP3410163.1 plasmid partitioning protein RepB [Bosea sp. (in: a-proteobacteria)]
MARKNPFANLLAKDTPSEEQPALDYAVKGASKSFLNSLNEITARADRLMEGEPIVELDPDSVDPSFIKDRLEENEQDFNEILEAIRARGQDSPILVRPHPASSERYMVVFGHRRLKVAKLLGRKVRAVIKEMKDREHVVAQGQENSARANLSFIEKALYASELAKLRYDDDNAIVMTALALDRSTLSKMLAVAGLPEKVLRAIGPAKGIGRDRWYELKLLLERPSHYDAAIAVIEGEGFAELPTEERFAAVERRLKTKQSRSRSEPDRQSWAPHDGAVAAEMLAEGRKFTLAIKAKGPDAKAFGRYLSDNLDRLYDDFRRRASATTNGD